MEKKSAKLDLAQCATLACLLEVSAPKVGNVHRGADFSDMSLCDFLISAATIGPIIAQGTEKSPGKIALEAVEATQLSVGKNSNLGTILLLAPLASVPQNLAIAEGIKETIAKLDHNDARWIYEAIRLAKPGGMGKQAENDIAQSPPDNIMIAMRQAAATDLIAKEYVEHFPISLSVVPNHLTNSLDKGLSISSAIVHTQLLLMAEYPDSLIARKCGEAVAEESSIRAAAVLESGKPLSEPYCRSLADFDFWSRSDGHRRNPGTTADLIAAGLFVALRENLLQLPLPQQDQVEFE